MWHWSGGPQVRVLDRCRRHDWLRRGTGDRMRFRRCRGRANGMTFRVACVPPTSRIMPSASSASGGRDCRLADKPGLVAARKTLAALLMPFRPKTPLRGPVVLGVVFEWPWTLRHSKATRQGGRLPHIAPPDLSNVIKTLEDVLVSSAISGGRSRGRRPPCREVVERPPWFDDYPRPVNPNA